MRIVDPTYGTVPTAPRPARTDVSSPAAAGLCGFSNSKPGANDLLNGVLTRLAERHPVGEPGFSAKPNASVAATSEVLDRVAERYRMAVVAIGD